MNAQKGQNYPSQTIFIPCSICREKVETVSISALTNVVYQIREQVYICRSCLRLALETLDQA